MALSYRARNFPAKNFEEEMLRFCQWEGEHLLWKGGLTDGYGTMGWKGTTVRVHRQLWIEKNGPIPPGLVVMHECDIRNCVNLAHLKLGTHTENMHDVIKKGRHTRRKVKEGEGWANLKLTEDQVRYILTSPKGGNALARELGVSSGLVSMIRTRKLWKDIIV